MSDPSLLGTSRKIVCGMVPLSPVAEATGYKCNVCHQDAVAVATYQRLLLEAQSYARDTLRPNESVSDLL